MQLRPSVAAVGLAVPRRAANTTRVLHGANAADDYTRTSLYVSSFRNLRVLLIPSTALSPTLYRAIERTQVRPQQPQRLLVVLGHSCLAPRRAQRIAELHPSHSLERRVPWVGRTASLLQAAR